MVRQLAALAVGAMTVGAMTLASLRTASAAELREGGADVKHVLLVSVDGLHALDSRTTSPRIPARPSRSSAITA